MDYSLDVIVSKSDLDNIGFKEKTFIWEGREHSPHLCHLVTKHDLKEFWKFRDFT